MRRKTMRAMTAFVAAAAVSVGSLSCCVAAAQPKAQKEETVYIKVDGAGEPQSVVVSDQLRNLPEGQATDVSSLYGIENVKGDETFQQLDGQLVWQSQGQEICYQGTTDRSAPVGIAVTYRLDGKEISPEALEGQSGHLEITYTYENTSEADNGTFTPFLMVTGLLLEPQQFSNVTVDNGRVVGDGTRLLVIGMGLPGLRQALGNVGPELPESFTVSADVSEYSPIESISVATNEVFSDLEAGTLDSVGTWMDAMAQLQTASQQLADGSGQLAEGLQTLLSSSDQLIDGIDALDAGGQSLWQGTLELTSGANTLAGGLHTASDKVGSQLLPGAAALDAGLQEMQAKLQDPASLPSLVAGVEALDTALNTGSGQTPALKDAARQVGQSAGTLAGGVDQAAAGAAALSQGLQQVGTGASSLSGGLESAAATTVQLNTAAQGLQSMLAQMAQQGTHQVQVQLDDVPLQNVTGTATGTATGTVSGTATGTVSVQVNGAAQYGDAVANLQSALSQLEPGSAAYTAIETALSQLGQDRTVSATGTIENATIADAVMPDATIAQAQISDATGTVQNYTATVENPDLTAAAQQAAGLAQGMSGLNDAFWRADGLLAGARRLDAALNTGDGTAANPVGIVQSAQRLSQAIGSSEEGQTSLQSGAQQLQAGANAVADGVEQTASGVQQLRQGLTGADGLVAQMEAGLQALCDGSAQLLDGVDGNDGLAAGLNQLAGGADQLVQGSGKLQGGAKELADGLQTMQSGSGALVDGVQKLSDGATTLHESMLQFDEQGIGQLAQIVDGQIRPLLERADGVLSASRDYQTFTGLSDQMEGSVKFVFVTDR